VKFYRSEQYNPDAFRIAVTSSFTREDLKEYHLHQNTIKRVLTAFAGFVNRKNQNVYGKSLNQIAQTANVCKESALKSIRFLESMGYLTVKKGYSRYSNTYFWKRGKLIFYQHG